MIDLTPLDVRKKRGDFRRILRGYDPGEVDSFLELVGERLEELVKNNLVLSERAERLERSVTALEQRESAVQDALVTAQRLRTEVQEQSRRDAEILRDQTHREAQLLRAEAEAEIARRLGEVEKLVLESRRSLEDLERSRRKFLKAFRGLLERELDTVEVEEARAPLEEIPLELELRRWIPVGDAAGGGGGLSDVSGKGQPEAAEEDLPEEDLPEEEFPEEDPRRRSSRRSLRKSPQRSPWEDSLSSRKKRPRRRGSWSQWLEGPRVIGDEEQGVAAEEPDTQDPHLASYGSARWWRGRTGSGTGTEAGAGIEAGTGSGAELRLEPKANPKRRRNRNRNQDRRRDLKRIRRRDLKRLRRREALSLTGSPNGSSPS
jgi:cell division initiation protein